MFTLAAIGSVLVSLWPSWLKIGFYRLIYGYEIGKGVRIGFGTTFLRVKSCRIGDRVRIGPGNLFCDIERIEIGEHTRIGSLNLFRGGERISLGRYVTVMRWNVFNSIVEPDAANTTTPHLELGAGSVVTTGHWLDFTDQITFGEQTILGGRNSSLWTHNRRRTRPIEIGAHCYLGSEVRIAPGVVVASHSIVALGSVLMGEFAEAKSLILGNPARIERQLKDRDLELVLYKTRDDIPDGPNGACPSNDNERKQSVELE